MPRPTAPLHPRPRAVRGSLAVALALAAAAAGCSSDDGSGTASSVPASLPVPAEQVVITAIGRYDRDRLRPGAEVAEEYLLLTFQTVWSLPGPAARCATDALLEDLGGRAVLDDSTLGELNGAEVDDRERAAAESCASAEDLARMPTSQLAPDVDPARLRALQVELVTRAGRARGLTAVEARCVATGIWGPLTDQQVLAVVEGGAAAQSATASIDAGAVVRSCLGADRLTELARRLYPELEEQRQDTPASTAPRLPVGGGATPPPTGG